MGTVFVGQVRADGDKEGTLVAVRYMHRPIQRPNGPMPQSVRLMRPFRVVWI